MVYPTANKDVKLLAIQMSGNNWIKVAEFAFERRNSSFFKKDRLQGKEVKQERHLDSERKMLR